MDIVRALYPLERALVSDGTDAALALVADALPEAADWSVETYAPGSEAWTWRVPERYRVDEAFLETEDGERVVDHADHPLHLVSYSEPVDLLLDWDELEPHLHRSAERPGAIPFEFAYYERTWGFCLTKERFDSLPRDVRYRAVIRSEFDGSPDQGLRVGVATIEPEGADADDAGEFLVCAHVCHPGQANDDASGVASAVGVARALAKRPLPARSMRVRFLFCPETIGSVAYLANHEELIPRLRGGAFVEMTGNDNSLVLQRTRQDDHPLDRIARAELAKREPEPREGAFREVVGNDEMVINGPGVNVPCISVSRWPYPEYHTSDDDPSILSEERLADAAGAVEQIVRVYASNYVPVREFRGPLFLSGHGLWVDWRINRPLNRGIEKIMLRLEGDHSLWDIAEEVGLDYWEVREWVERLLERGLASARPLGERDPDAAVSF